MGKSGNWEPFQPGCHKEVDELNRHTIVLAEEKAGIQRLVKKAVETKPMGQEKIEQVLPVADKTALFEAVTQLSGAVVLLSTTFSSEHSHESLLKELNTRCPSVKVISLTHKYGDRSSLDFGAFESVDKPIRNPVLWEILDRAIDASETGEAEQPKPENVTPAIVAQPVKQAVAHIPEKKPEAQPVVEPARKTPVSPLLVINDEDDEDEDDLFGNSNVPVRKPQTAVVVFTDEPEPTLEIEEEAGIKPESEPAEPVLPPFFMEEDKEEETNDEPGWSIEPEEEVAIEPDVPAQHGLGHETVIVEVVPVVEFDIPNDKEPEEIPEEPQQVLSVDDMDEGFSFDVTDNDDTEEELETEPEELVEPKDEDASELPETNGNEVHNETLLMVETDVEEDVEPVEPAPNPLEPETAINSETAIYNELSEWTLAHEGFTTKNGDFVPLAPPRAQMRESSPATNRVQRTTSAKTATEQTVDGDGFFGSVRSIFKKK